MIIVNPVIIHKAVNRWDIRLLDLGPKRVSGVAANAAYGIKRTWP